MTLIMNYGHHLTVDMVIRSVSWVNRQVTLEESRTQSVSMAKNWREKYLGTYALVMKWTMNVMLGTTRLMMEDVPSLRSMRNN